MLPPIDERGLGWVSKIVQAAIGRKTMKYTYLLHALPAVLEFEGGYSDDPNDSGGPTNFGITQAEYDAHRSACGETPQSVKLISQAEYQNIYRNNYWTPIHGDDLPYPLDWLTFDAAVNMGVGTAISLLAEASGAQDPHYTVDPALLALIQRDCATLAGTHAVKEADISDRIALYREIVADHSQDSVFLQGWLNRAAQLSAES